jgi:hypothetical protein
LTRLDHDWDSPVWSHRWHALSRHRSLVRYDERGCGLSDWDVDAGSFTLDAWVRDLDHRRRARAAFLQDSEPAFPTFVDEVERFIAG